MSHEIILDYVEDEYSNANEDTDNKVGVYDTEDVEEDDDDENNNAQTAKSSNSDTSRKISLSNSIRKISLTEQTSILVSNDIKKTNNFLNDFGPPQHDAGNFL